MIPKIRKSDPVHATSVVNCMATSGVSSSSSAPPQTAIRQGATRRSAFVFCMTDQLPLSPLYRSALVQGDGGDL